MMQYLLSFSNQIIRPAFIFVFFFASTVITVSTLLFFHFEYGYNDKIHNLFDCLYYTITIFSGVGLGDIVPHTRSGKILSMFIMLIGTALYASFTAIAAITLLSIEQNKKN